MATENTGNTAEVIVNINGNTEGLDQALQGVNAELQKTTNADLGANNVKSLKAQLREATAAAVALQQAGKSNTEEYRTQVAAIAELRDQQEELNHVVAAFNPDNKFAGLVNIAKGAATAVQGFTGAMSFLGAESDNAAATLAKLQGIMAFTDALGSIGDIKDGFKGFTDTIKSSIGAFQGAGGAAKGFGLALKGIGIGLLISAIAYLITNFDDIKESFSDILPAGDKLGKMFDTLKQVFFGVGNAVLQFIIAPIKALIDVINGDFKKAMKDLEKGVDFVNNYQTGAEKEKGKQLKAELQEQAKTLIEDSKRKQKLLKAGSKEYLEEENRQADLRVTAAANEAERKEALNDREALYVQRKYKAQDEAAKKAEEAQKARDAKAKANAEKIAAERKAALEELKKVNADAAKVLAEQNDTARDKELNAVREEYEKRLALATKYNQSTVLLTEAFARQQQAINEKYDKSFEEAIKERGTKNLDAYATREKEINKFYDGLLATATDKQKELIEINRKNELIAAGDEDALRSIASDATNNLGLITATNQVDDKDNPDVAYEKRTKVLNAELEAEQTAYDLKKMQLQGNNEELEALEAAHTIKMIDIERGRVEASKQLAEAEAKAKADALGVAADAAGAFAGLAGEQTVAGKALAVAGATISTYLAATQAYASASAIPIYGQIAGPLAAAAAIAAGLANVRQILKVNVPGKGSGGGGSVPSMPSTANVTAPMVSAALANGVNGVQDVRVTNQEDQVIQAYITDKQLQDNQDRSTFLNNLSTI